METFVTFPDLVKHDGELLAVEFVRSGFDFRTLNNDEKQELSEYDFLLSSIPFPTNSVAASRCECSGSALLQMLENFLATSVGVIDADRTAIAAFIVSTFFADVLPVVPSLALIARVPEDALAAFTAISSVCRHAILIDASVPLECLPLFLHPLLAIDATALAASRLDRVVPLGSPIINRVVGSRVESIIAPRLILSREPVRNASLNLACKPCSCRTLSDAQSIVDMLAGYRLRRYKEVGQHAQTCWRPVETLAACFHDDDCTRERVAAAVSALQQVTFSAIDDCSEENFLTQALHNATHTQTCVKVLDLANVAMSLSEREGLRCAVSPKFVAAFLRRNGLKLRHARVGLVLEIDPRSARIVHQLYAEAFGVHRQVFPDCVLCGNGPPQLQTH